MSKVLVTGCGGFVGRVLVGDLVKAGHEVWGVDRVSDEAGSFAGAKYLTGDLVDKATVAGLLAEAQPEHIVHLAAQSSVQWSFEHPFDTIINNTLPTLHILDYMKESGRRCRLLAVGSADEYGVVSESALPLNEQHQVNPGSPYALAKSIQNQYCHGYATLYGLDVVITRSFNHTGAGQRDTFVLPSFARQVTEIALGQRDPVISVGNLEVRRDFLDVRDVCAAYALLLTRGERGEIYNVCSGSSHRIRDLLDQLCGLAGVKVDIRVDPERVRPVDMPDLCGDPSKLNTATGWAPSISMADTLQSLLDYWRDQLQQQGE